MSADLNPLAMSHSIRESIRRLEGFLELAHREVSILQGDIDRLTVDGGDATPKEPPSDAGEGMI